MGQKKVPSFGLVKFGAGKRCSALACAVPLGVVLAATVAALLSFRDDRLVWWQTFLVFLICMTPVCVSIIWVLIVDRETIPGRLKKPEQSIESTWISNAAANSFYTILAALGLVTAGFSLFGSENVAVILFWVLIAVICIYGIFYVLARFEK